jgi:SAM-dependent methyltransferase
MRLNEKDENQCKACGLALSERDSVGVKNGYSLLRCESCDTITVAPFPTENQLIEFYQKYRGTTGYSLKKVKKIARAKKRIKKIMHYASGNKFLDVGCNAGYTVAAARSIGLDAIGIDVDCDAVEKAQQDYGESYFSCIKVQDFSKSDQVFDVIYSSEVIEHVPDPDSFVESLAKLLVKDGVLYLTTPDGNHFSLPKKIENWTAVVPPEHIVYFSKKGLEIIFKRHGLKIIKNYLNLKPGIRLIAKKIK